jgi:mersacidin/lichenicidin family type 2 lantibiotic
MSDSIRPIDSNLPAETIIRAWKDREFAKSLSSTAPDRVADNPAGRSLRAATAPLRGEQADLPVGPFSTSCHSTSCHSTSCHSTSCHSTSCHSSSCHSTRCHSSFCGSSPCETLQCPTGPKKCGDW